MSRPRVPIELSPQQQKELQKLVARTSTPQQLAFRARLILESAKGLPNYEVARVLNTSQQTLGLWRRRFIKGGIGALKDEQRSGRPVRIPEEIRRDIITKCVQPPEHKARWTTRSMASKYGVSKDTVHKLWRRNDIKPHRVRIFKISSDEQFEEKFWDIVGLYFDPPVNAVLLCCDEKSQCQALQRTQPGLPLNVGHIRTRTHDYYRNGTITLFAALDYLNGKIIAQTAARHRHKEWLGFLKKINSEIDPNLDIHIICDNYATHKHETVRTWLKKHPRFRMHFTPTSASWMNMVERFFRDISQQSILPGSFASVGELVETIEGYLKEHNLKPKRYQWRADGQAVLDKIKRALEAAINHQPIIPKAI